VSVLCWCHRARHWHAFNCVGIMLVPPCQTLTCLQLEVLVLHRLSVFLEEWIVYWYKTQHEALMCVSSHVLSLVFISNATSWYKYSQTKHRQFFNFWKFRKRTMLLVPGNLLCLTLVNIDRLPNIPRKWHFKRAPLIFYTFKVEQLTM